MHCATNREITPNLGLESAKTGTMRLNLAPCVFLAVILFFSFECQELKIELGILMFFWIQHPKLGENMLLTYTQKFLFKYYFLKSHIQVHGFLKDFCMVQKNKLVTH